ncbi:MAG: (2Fe-2S)-binding protein [Methylococcales bacterium]|nr:(2Fe-2S)-binding protein [Methylococcales bacterium]NBW29610.1 (2Fe-2S)-binding protein [bacterium]
MSTVNTDQEQDEETVCHCTGTTQGKIKNLFSEGCTHFEAMAERSGVCSGCGGCEDAVRDLINDLKYA